MNSQISSAESLTVSRPTEMVARLFPLCKLTTSGFLLNESSMVWLASSMVVETAGVTMPRP